MWSRNQTFEVEGAPCTQPKTCEDPGYQKNCERVNGSYLLHATKKWAKMNHGRLIVVK